jgi:hypothetical protein
VITDNFQVVWDLIDTNNDGEINLQDIIGCDRDASGGCNKTETFSWLNTAGVPEQWNDIIGFFFEGIIKAFEAQDYSMYNDQEFSPEEEMDFRHLVWLFTENYGFDRNIL